MGDWLGAHIEGDLRRARFEIEFKIRSRSLVQNLESSLERHGRRSSVDVLEGAVRDGWMVPVVLVYRTRVCRTRVSYSCVVVCIRLHSFVVVCVVQLSSTK